MTERLWSVTGVCEELGVGQGVITNWRVRYEDTPPPSYHVYSGQERFAEAWDVDGVQAWKKWRADHEVKMAHRYRKSRMGA
jgi:hypothetical protein